MSQVLFPSEFTFGAATSSYQIEGAWDEDGKGESIWDRFAHTGGTIEDASTGDIACDHIHRLDEDLDWMSALGLDAYRFSVSWPRILPAGRGAVNGRGLDFYDRLVDGLLARGIRPFLTLYHWDLPQVLQDAGGWTTRDTADAFCEYAQAVAGRLGDRVKDWITLNEPFVSSVVGHWESRHAPGHRNEDETLAAAHHLLLAHGRSVPILRDLVPDARIGITNVHMPFYAASSSDADRRATAEADGLLNRMFLDPLAGRGYPEIVPFDRSRLDALVQPGDLKSISEPLDFLGVNYYTRRIVRSQRIPETENEPITVCEGREKTQMDWEVYPDGLFEVFERLHADYGFRAYYVTENGAAYTDKQDDDGHINDWDRIAYLDGHLRQVRRILDSGIPLRGYFAWSLMDNFEWAHGYTKRFGLLHVDFETGKRTPKESFAWYQRAITERGLPDDYERP